jgi:Zn-dependent M28 family amino/carboxypeptidase
VARLLAPDLKPQRSIVFVAFDGEEWGLKGSRRLARTRTAAQRPFAMINLDAVGRLGAKKLLVLGAGTADEWRHIAMGIGFTTGVESTCVADDPGGSDQVSFHEIGVPAIQLFTGPHEDYHRPSDTADKVDYDGMVKVATWLREAVVYLADRKEPLTSTLKTGPSAGAPKPADGAPAAAGVGARRVSLGTMPEFEFAGPGVRVASVIAGSPAEKAGIAAGDVILAIDGADVADLKGYSALLKTKKPGDKVKVRVRRGDETKELEATLAAR